MLAADKLLLRSHVKQNLISLREKELNLFNSNFSAVATQAALLAGFSLRGSCPGERLRGRLGG